MPGSPSPEALRLFISLSVPEAVKQSIEAAQTELRRVATDNAARWTRREQFHLTLRFLGNVPVNQLEELVEQSRLAARTFGPLHLTAQRLGFFPNAKLPRVVWAGISDRDNQLTELWRSIQSAVEPFTKEPPERQFKAHVTLGRINRLRRPEAVELAKTAAQFDNQSFGHWTASQLELMRSELSPTGARHSELAAIPLLGASRTQK